MEIKYFRVCRVRCLVCGEVLEHVNRSKEDNYHRMITCKCGNVSLDPSATLYRIVGDFDKYEDLSEEWKD